MHVAGGQVTHPAVVVLLAFPPPGEPSGAVTVTDDHVFKHERFRVHAVKREADHVYAGLADRAVIGPGAEARARWVIGALIAGQQGTRRQDSTRRFPRAAQRPIDIVQLELEFPFYSSLHRRVIPFDAFEFIHPASAYFPADADDFDEPNRCRIGLIEVHESYPIDK